MRVFHMGHGLPPFEFVYSGTTYTIHPPDQQWKKVTEEYDIGVKVLQNGGATGKMVKGTREVWQPQPGTRPRRNYLDLTEDQFRFIHTGKYAEARREYLRTDRELEKDMEQEVDGHMEDHARRIAEIKRAQIAELAALEKQHKESLESLPKSVKK